MALAFCLGFISVWEGKQQLTCASNMVVLDSPGGWFVSEISADFGSVGALPAVAGLWTAAGDVTVADSILVDFWTAGSAIAGVIVEASAVAGVAVDEFAGAATKSAGAEKSAGSVGAISEVADFWTAGAVFAAGASVGADFGQQQVLQW